MKAEIKTIWIDSEISKELAGIIEETELEPMGDNQYIGEFEIEIEDNTLLKFPFLVLVTCSGKLIQEGKNYPQSHECPPEFYLWAQYINNIDLKCYIDGEEVEFNSAEIQERIEKLITK